MASEEEIEGDVIMIGLAGILPNIDELERLQNTLTSAAALAKSGSKQLPSIEGWLSESEINTFAEKIAWALNTPLGPDILIKILPALIDLRKEVEKEGPQPFESAK